jgi:GTPase SAR1 family protein
LNIVDPVYKHYKSDFNVIENGFRDADAAIIMFDVLSQSSYDNVPKWYNEITSKCEEIPILLIGNKCMNSNLI